MRFLQPPVSVSVLSINIGLANQSYMKERLSMDIGEQRQFKTADVIHDIENNVVSVIRVSI